MDLTEAQEGGHSPKDRSSERVVRLWFVIESHLLSGASEVVDEAKLDFWRCYEEEIVERFKCVIVVEVWDDGWWE